MMRRPYTVSFYARLVDRITRLMPHAAVGSDIIVGFPGEASRHFAEMLAALEKMPLTYLHVFPYPTGRAHMRRNCVQRWTGWKSASVRGRFAKSASV